MWQDHDEYHHDERGTALPEAEANALRKILTKLGTAEVARQSRVSKDTLARAAARLPIYGRSATKIRAYLGSEGSR